MRIHHTAGLLTASAVLALAACTPQSADDGKPTTPGAPAKPSAAHSGAGPGSRTATLPDLVGKGLQAAQDEAQAAGFRDLASHDALGRDRLQVLDRNWKVCSQTPAAGTKTDTGARIDLGTVKLEETCPAHDAPAPSAAGDTMPDFVGKGMKAVRAALPGNASVTVKDALHGRMVLMESNWQVCAQTPAAGAPLAGRPVSFQVVKTDEKCP
ncbi:PASTA domain-containing protein [Streptomyces sp. NPDC089919]|uniref:PASTA domain-containing protein n=1 Tax=Streptomyces sp. NPDC089919 TaxID=3155188 RepID=UPI0034134620